MKKLSRLQKAVSAAEEPRGGPGILTQAQAPICREEGTR